MNIYVGNLSHSITEKELSALFEEFGRVASAVVIKDKLSGDSKGFGFVDMPSKTEAMTAMQNLNGKDLNGRNITVNEARPREDKRDSRGGGDRGRSGGPGGGGGRRDFNRGSGGSGPGRGDRRF